MKKRVVFKSNDICTSFFNKLKDTFSKQTWVNVRKEFNIPRKTFDSYLCGKYTIPESIFNQFIARLNEKDKIYFSSKILFKDSKWGVIKGGKTNYKKHPEIYKKGRILGAEKNASKHNFDKDMPLSNELCEFIGAFIGDGFLNSYRKGNYMMQFTGDSKLDYFYYKKVVIPITDSLFNKIKPRVTIKDRVLRVSFYSKNLFKMLSERFKIPKGKKVYDVKIPEEIIHSKNKKLLFFTIRGIFDTDGCVFLDKRSKYKNPYPRITLQIANFNLYHQLQDILKEHFTLYTNEKRDRKFYIEIYGHKQLNKWMSLIGFSNSRHLNKIAPVAQSVQT